MNVFLLLGTNLGDRNANLARAKNALGLRAGRLVLQSAVYQTAAWGNTDQPAFYNQVLILDSPLPPETLLNLVLTIEEELGRTRSIKWGARVIDIDVLFYGSEIIEKPDLIIPHPQLHNRRFTLVPLVEVAPDFVHPHFGKSMQQLLKECTDTLAVERLPEISFDEHESSGNRNDLEA